MKPGTKIQVVNLDSIGGNPGFYTGIIGFVGTVMRYPNKDWIKIHPYMKGGVLRRHNVKVVPCIPMQLQFSDLYKKKTYRLNSYILGMPFYMYEARSVSNLMFNTKLLAKTLID